MIKQILLVVQFKDISNQIIQFSQAFYNNLLELKTNKKFVVLGDFNFDYGRYATDSAVKMFADRISSLSCEQLISWPTKISPSKQSTSASIYV